jgi:hypothetical protein
MAVPDSFAFNNNSAPVKATSLLAKAASHVPSLIEVSEEKV